MMKRLDYITWDNLFIGIAKLASERSKDPNTQCGSCIVKNNKVLSIGFNGLPYGLNDNGSIENGREIDYWDKSIKYEIVIHSELNAILNAKQDLTGSTLYLYTEKGYFPCSNCSGAIVQSGISEIVMNFAIKNNTEVYNWDITKHILKNAGVNIRILEKT